MITPNIDEDRYKYAFDIDYDVSWNVWEMVGKRDVEYRVMYRMVCILKWLDLADLECAATP